ncbi:EamA family transporter [Streptomyces sp. YC504]|uniref:EamA family transporter n=2 Tax=Streptomyces mesophilus TaxID=1775132 RepID=A0A6G4XCQ1_9ACTN|nr:EamA family transporter [Streptomyces mesophilus]
MPMPVPRLRGSALAVVAMISVQTGAGTSSWLFDRFGVPGTAWLRLTWAAAVLWLIARPRIRGRDRRELGTALLLGAVSGLLTLLYFEAVVRIPLGTATALEFLGPLAVAVAGLRRRVDALWPLAATVGVLALTRPWSGAVDLAGVGFALGAAVGWAGYILLTKRVGDQFTGLGGLAVSMAAASVVTLPFADVARVAGQMDLSSFALSGLAALLLPILPYAAEMVALRDLPTAVFGTLMSLEPAVGVVVGSVVLSQQPSWPQVLGVVLVTFAGIGTVLSTPREATPRVRGPDAGGKRPSSAASGGRCEAEVGSSG